MDEYAKTCLRLKVDIIELTFGNHFQCELIIQNGKVVNSKAVNGFGNYCELTNQRTINA